MRIRVAIAALLVSACSENRTPLGPDAGPETGSFTCFPNLDGRLDRSEMPTRLDIEATYLVAEAAPVALEGQAWDFRAELAGERKHSITARPIDDQWFASSFPSSGFVVSLDASGSSLGILRADEASISLLGIASAAEDLTLLVYETPIDLYRFPLHVGKSWTSASVVTGKFEGVAYNGSDEYQVSVDARGELSLPHLRFSDAYRVNTRTRNDSGAAGVVVTRQQSSFLSECFGEVARATSGVNETEANFTTASELWRFSL